MVEAGSNTATGLPVASASTLHQVKQHFNESGGTSKCLPAAPQSDESSINYSLRSTGPSALRRFDLVPVGVDPPPEPGERLFKGSAEICEFVEICRVRPTGIEMPPDEAVALGASQRFGKDFVRDASQAFMKILVAPTPRRQLGQHHQRPAPTDQPDERRSLPPLEGHADDQR